MAYFLSNYSNVQFVVCSDDIQWSKQNIKNGSGKQFLNLIDTSFPPTSKLHKILEALRERRPPWPRQIITLILPTVKMLSLGCERLQTPLKKKKKKKGSGSLPAPRSGYATTIMVFFCSFTDLTIPRSPPKFNQFFLVLLRTPP